MIVYEKDQFKTNITLFLSLGNIYNIWDKADEIQCYYKKNMYFIASYFFWNFFP